MLSYHGDQDLKEKLVLEIKRHAEKDQFIKGTYEEKYQGIFKGCAIGCTIDSLNMIFGKEYETSDRINFEELLGIPECLAALQELFFEVLPDDENSKFAIDFFEAIPVGVDLNPIKWKFCSFLLKEGIDKINNQSDIPERLRKEVIDVQEDVLRLCELAICNGTWDENAAQLARSAAQKVALSITSMTSIPVEKVWKSWAAASAAASAAGGNLREAACASAPRPDNAEDAKCLFPRFASELLILLKTSGDEHKDK